MAGPLLVVGLGNPGPQYATTRHNIGFLVADILSDRIGSGFKVHKKSGAEVATGRLGGRAVVLAKPRCYMNESGRQVAALAKFYSVPSAELIVIHDELDIEFGRIRLKFGGGVAGHNGLRSVTHALGSREYYRVRIGIGRPPGRADPADYVLKDFGSAERKELPLVIELAADAVEVLLRLGLAAAQNQIHALGRSPA